MTDLRTYLQLLPKAELHCHFVSTMRPETLLELCQAHGVRLRTFDLDQLFDYSGLADFLDVFNAAHLALTTPDEIARIAYEGAQDAVAKANLRYREYFVNPDNFVRGAFGRPGPGMDYPTVIDAMISGLSAAERDFGVGFGIIIGINRSLPAHAAVDLVRTVVAHPRKEVLGIGQDDLTPEKSEDPLRFAEAYRLARESGLRCTAHVGETMEASPSDVVTAAIELRLDRIDHGYRVMDDPESLDAIKATGLSFTCTPHSTVMLSGWELTPEHRIARMIRAGLPVTLATDDAVFFKTDLAREYVEALPAMDITADEATAIARQGFIASWCPDQQKQRLLADFDGAVLALRTALL